MLSYPFQQSIIVHGSGSDREADFYDILIGAFQSDTIDLQKCQHNIHTDTLVAVHKGVVGNQIIAQTSTLFLLGGHKSRPIVGLSSGDLTYSSTAEM